MKISPDREQLMLVIIMNSLIVFIIAVLSLEMLLAPSSNVAESEPPVVAAPAREKVRPKVEESIQLQPSELKLPEEEPVESRSDIVELPREVGQVAVPVERNPDPAKAKPPMPAPQPVATASQPPAKPVEEEPAEPAVAAESGYTVQMGAFSTEEKASLFAAKLGALKLGGKSMPVMQQSIKSGKKVLYRVRLGPFSSQAQAKQAASLASRQASAEGTVLRPGQ